jgi:hypothetical protein
MNTKMKHILFFTTAVMIIVACKTKNKVVTNNAANTISESVPTTATITPLPDSLYRFRVSFVSIGTGVDRNAKRQFIQYINEFGQKHNITLKYESVSWGKEGEVDYCFKLSEVKQNLQHEFIDGLKNVLKNSTLVRYHEYATCRKTRNK